MSKYFAPSPIPFSSIVAAGCFSVFVLAVPEVPNPWDLHLGLSVEGRPGLISVQFGSGSSSLTADLLLPIPLVLLAP